MNYVDAEFDSTIIDEREMMAFFEVKAFCFPTYLAKETIDLLFSISRNRSSRAHVQFLTSTKSSNTLECRQLHGVGRLNHDHMKGNR